MQRLADQSSSRTRLAALLLAAMIEAAMILGLLHGLAMARLAGTPPVDAIVAFRDFRDTPPPAKQQAPLSRRAVAPKPSPTRAGAGRQATARAVAAPVPRIVLATLAAPAVAATGQADSAGAARDGAGAGHDKQGSGGSGGGVAVEAIKLSGEIDSARDYPPATRDLRLGDHVILALGIDSSGMVDDCRVVRASRDAASDAVTCRLARERFRFRPARDARGNAVRSTFGWQQRWFRPGSG